MKRLFISTFPLAALLMMSPAAIAHTLHVQAGKSIQIYDFAYFNNKCKSTGRGSYYTIGEPKLGKVVERRKRIKIERVTSKTLNQCIGKRMPGSSILYKAGKTKGRDNVVLQIIYPNGNKGEVVRHKIIIQ